MVKKKRTKTNQNGEWWDVYFGYRGQTPPTWNRSGVPSPARFLSWLSFHCSSGIIFMTTLCKLSKMTQKSLKFLERFLTQKSLKKAFLGEIEKKKKSIFRRCFVWDWKKAFTILAFFFWPKLGGNHFQKSFHKKKKHWEIEISWEKTQSWGGTNPTLYTTSLAPLRQPSPVERRVVGGPSIGERHCRCRLSQWSHHQTRSRVLGMFSTFPLFILAF